MSLKVIHVINGLHVGGAEMMLHKLLSSMDRTRFDSTVLSLTAGGECRALISDLGIPIRDLDLKGGGVSPSGVLALRRLALDLEPDVIQGWMYYGNLTGSLMTKFTPGDPRLFWNIRHSVADLGREKLSVRMAIRLGGLMSRRPDKIIYNSGVSVEQHALLGYARDKGLMIPNGFELDRFVPSEQARADLRRELGLSREAVLVGVAARRHPMKGHEEFLKAAALLRSTVPEVEFVLVGRGVTMDDPVLRELVQVPELDGTVHLPGQRDDMPSFFAGLDLLCVPSLNGEGFPNVLGEAMACGVPCVATDVGESRGIIADTGRIVEPGDPVALAAALAEMLQMDPGERLDLGRRCRDRIRDHYSLGKIAEIYEGLYSSE